MNRNQLTKNPPPESQKPASQTGKGQELTRNQPAIPERVTSCVIAGITLKAVSVANNEKPVEWTSVAFNTATKIEYSVRSKKAIFDYCTEEPPVITEKFLLVCFSEYLTDCMHGAGSLVDFKAKILVNSSENPEQLYKACKTEYKKLVSVVNNIDLTELQSGIENRIKELSSRKPKAESISETGKKTAQKKQEVKKQEESKPINKGKEKKVRWEAPLDEQPDGKEENTRQVRTRKTK